MKGLREGVWPGPVTSRGLFTPEGTHIAGVLEIKRPLINGANICAPRKRTVVFLVCLFSGQITPAPRPAARHRGLAWEGAGGHRTFQNTHLWGGGGLLPSSGRREIPQGETQAGTPQSLEAASPSGGPGGAGSVGVPASPGDPLPGRSCRPLPGRGAEQSPRQCLPATTGAARFPGTEAPAPPGPASPPGALGSLPGPWQPWERSR